jgi:hypothetical protein
MSAFPHDMTHLSVELHGFYKVVIYCYSIAGIVFCLTFSKERLLLLHTSIQRQTF